LIDRSFVDKDFVYMVKIVHLFEWFEIDIKVHEIKISEKKNNIDSMNQFEFDSKKASEKRNESWKRRAKEI